MTRLEQPVRISVNKASVSATPDRMGYVTISRAWKTGDQIEVEFPMEVRKVSADAKVTANRGRMAVERGPIVYCAEWPDCEGGRVLNLLFDGNRATGDVDRSGHCSAASRHPHRSPPS